MAIARLLDEALDLSREMLALSEKGDWNRVIELEPQRRDKINRALARRTTLNESDAGTIRDILALDKTLIRRGIEAREAVAAEIGQMRLGRKVSQAYRSVGD